MLLDVFSFRALCCSHFAAAISLSANHQAGFVPHRQYAEPISPTI
jgi:hypothetical protein